jgi:hypothetical protein
MTNLIIKGPPDCPLCLRRMREVIVDRKQVMYVCTEAECMISINSRDPAVGKWDMSKDRMPPCPIHGVPLRVFFRMLDGFIKGQCPSCRKEGRICQIVTGKVKELGPQDVCSVDVENLNEQKGDV